MKNDWILDVLVDLKNFAQVNDLPAVAEKLIETTDLAMIEIASIEKKARSPHGNEYTVGNYFGAAGNSSRA